ncbi:hypothetical protein CVT26_000956 [Gymnopilus dilepis]|uniref:Uncharacterized protein n=1 Tax=Gymnopilus dilepis TaxID=231916 RepID=A0A409WB20_9AGAR|nr:hypothetical protein CVT26_000956 [Gymnopilus dilepis]
MKLDTVRQSSPQERPHWCLKLLDVLSDEIVNSSKRRDEATPAPYQVLNQVLLLASLGTVNLRRQWGISDL